MPMSLKDRLLLNDFMFGIAATFMEHAPKLHRKFGESKIVYEYLSSTKDPIILNFNYKSRNEKDSSFKIKIDRNSAHDRDTLWTYLQNLMLDPLLSETIKNNLKDGGIFVDIGANNGFFSLLASTLVGSTGKVLAIEPTRRTFDRLTGNIELNGFNNILTLNVACGEANAEKEFQDYGSFDGSNSFVHMKGGKPTYVKVERLDGIYPWDKKPDFVKIDVEGYEREVLLGARNTILQNDSVTVVAEYNRSILRKKGEEYSAVIRLLTEYGFEIHEMVDSLVDISKRVVKSHRDLNPWGCNIYAFKPPVK